jgi:large subunit ribosomal protein L15
MQWKDLKPIHKQKKIKRIGRGGKRGAYSGRGLKGQKSRAGRKLKPAIREFIKRYPKLRGYRFKGLPPRLAVVNLEVLEKEFKEGEKISPQILLQKRIIRRISGRIPKVKILGTGEITKPLIIENCTTSKSAKEKIEKSKGTIR